MKAVFISDEDKFNALYRKPLIDLILSKGHQIESYGFFDNLSSALRAFWVIIFGKNVFVISSNIRSNLISLLLVKKNKLVILNGMGRHRKNKFFRLVIRNLLGFRGNVFLAVQNYADYRYFRRFSSKVKMKWVPGSGGTKKKSAHN